MRVALYNGEHSVKALAGRLYQVAGGSSLGGQLEPSHGGPQVLARRAGEALVRSNAALADLGKVKPGMVLIVPDVVGLTPVEPSTWIVGHDRGDAAAILRALAAEDASAEAAVKARIEELKQSVELLGSDSVKPLLRFPAFKELRPQMVAEAEAAIADLQSEQDARAATGEAIRQDLTALTAAPA